MNKVFYPKLAADNIRKNFKTYFPYILTCIFTVAMYYIMYSLSVNKGLNNIFGAATTAYILNLGTYVIAIFACIFLFYSNSFLTKKRKKEFGLMNILGMEKKHIAKIMGFESIYVTLISLVCGLGFGIFLDKLMYIAVARLVRAKISLGFYISGEAIISSVILFSILFFFIFLNSIRLIHLSNPIELLNGGKTGEKEPKAKWLIAFLGLASLGGGYYIALTIKNPVVALASFFIAVILVIIGTYLIFSAGSITFLKILKKNKRYYYKTNHFISVSGMIYRMKQNATGLANICILSTMVLVMVSSTASLIIGVDDIIQERYPTQFEVGQETYNTVSDEGESIKNAVLSIAKEENVKLKNEVSYTELQFQMILEKDLFRCGGNGEDFSDINNAYNIFAINASDYNAYTGENISLEENEVLLYLNKGKYKYDHFSIFDRTYTIKDTTEKFIENLAVNAEICPTFGIVVKDNSEITFLYNGQEKLYKGNASSIYYSYCFDTDLDNDGQTAFGDTLLKRITVVNAENDPDHPITGFIMNCRENQRTDTYSLFGGLFFLGIFLGLLFTMATVLIIYYKQISEGYDDKGRFEIMQKVGMSEQEVKSSIRSQVITIFFMPLITAGIHLTFAFPMVRKMLALFQLTNVKLFIKSNICVFLIFSLIYVTIYLLTTKTYYKIVKK